MVIKSKSEACNKRTKIIVSFFFYTSPEVTELFMEDRIAKVWASNDNLLTGTFG